MAGKNKATLLALLATSAPKLTVSTDLINLGQIKPSQAVEEVFTVQNSGEADLVINSITTDGPCTCFQFVKDGKYQPDTPISISPGEKVEIKLTFESGKTKYIGTLKKLSVISSNDPEAPLRRLAMVGQLTASAI